MNNLTVFNKWIKVIYAITIVLIIVSIINVTNSILQVQQGIEETKSILAEISALAQVFVRLIGFFVFLIWFYKAYQNHKMLNPEYATTTPGMAVGYYFIPFLNFYKPYQTMDEVYGWAVENDSDSSDLPIVSMWWGLFIISTFLSRAIYRMSDGLNKDYIYLSSDLLEIGLFCVELLIISKISVSQTDKINKVV